MRLLGDRPGSLTNTLEVCCGLLSLWIDPGRAGGCRKGPKMCGCMRRALQERKRLRSGVSGVFINRWSELRLELRRLLSVERNVRLNVCLQ